MEKSKKDYEKLLNPFRLQRSTKKGRKPIDEFYSDRSRILYSSSFRRLQQKAQVFSLEPNSNVRTRLTHSLEVSDIGRSLSRNICIGLIDKKIISSNSFIPQRIVAVVENACLLHDIGNPPFGHFGEEAIKKWVNEKMVSLGLESGLEETDIEKIKGDFEDFDGNPQGLRTVMHVHCERDSFGLNLTAPTLLSCIKYPRVAGEKFGDVKKAGYFTSEYDKISKLNHKIGRTSAVRYPLSYIMEAADDIAYCLSDISDGIEKGIITLETFLSDFQECWSGLSEGPLPGGISYDANDFIYYDALAVAWSNAFMRAASKNYIENHEEIMAGTAEELFDSGEYATVLKAIKQVSRKKLYRSPEAESIELSGYAVISGLLKHFGELLKLKRSDFESLISENDMPFNKGLDLQWRIRNQLSPRSVKCYRNSMNSMTEFRKINEKKVGENTIEWWLRAHLIIDHISGMTDRFALETYQMFEGML